MGLDESENTAFGLESLKFFLFFFLFLFLNDGLFSNNDFVHVRGYLFGC